jgi:hypothetical protein
MSKNLEAINLPETPGQAEGLVTSNSDKIGENLPVRRDRLRRLIRS